jgi:uncharacterized protein YjbJ (UPF0337 family)
MTINENTVAGKWLELKGEVQKAWGKLTSDDLEKTKGDFKAISGLLQQKYGSSEESYKRPLTDIFARFEAKKDAAVETIKTSLKN